MSNFTDKRASINITSNTNGELIPNETYSSKAPSELIGGDNVIYN